MSNVLVLGGTYFIGLKTVERLVGEGHAVTTLTRGTHDERLPDEVEALNADRSDKREIERALEGRSFDGVIETSWLSHRETRQAARLLGDRVEAYLFVSSAAVYRQSQIFPIREDFPRFVDDVPEDDVTPGMQYGWRKGKAEELLQFLASSGIMNAAAVRPFYVYGEENNLDRETYLFDRVESGEPLLIPGDGQGVLHLGHIEDLTRALVGILELLIEGDVRVRGSAFNFGGPDYATVEGIYQVIEELAGAGERERIRYAPHEVEDHRDLFPFRHEHFFGDVSQLGELGLAPEIGIEEGLERTLNWYQGTEGHEREWSREREIAERYG